MESGQKMADDVMIFPDTWKEFEKQYGFYDSKQAYMYGNTRLIPSFRVQQWLYHIDDIKRKKQLQKNKMEQVAKLFGKKLGEEFKVQKEYVINPCYAMFTADGLAITDGNGYLLTGMDIDLMGYTVNTEDLLTARAVIVDE